MTVSIILLSVFTVCKIGNIDVFTFYNSCQNNDNILVNILLKRSYYVSRKTI